VESWRQIDFAGRLIIEGILDKIQAAPFADLTRLNFNATFEVGYALGREKRVVHSALKRVQNGGFLLSGRVRSVSVSAPSKVPKRSLEETLASLELDNL
jgi:hypothetical protein